MRNISTFPATNSISRSTNWLIPLLVNNTMVQDGKQRSNVRPGAKVQIVLKEDQRLGNLPKVSLQPFWPTRSIIHMALKSNWKTVKLAESRKSSRNRFGKHNHPHPWYIPLEIGGPRRKPSNLRLKCSTCRVCSIAFSQMCPSRYSSSQIAFNNWRQGPVTTWQYRVMLTAYVEEQLAHHHKPWANCYEYFNQLAFLMSQIEESSLRVVKT